MPGQPPPAKPKFPMILAVLTPLRAGGNKTPAAVHIIQNKKTGFGKPSAQHAHAMANGEFPKPEKEGEAGASQTLDASQTLQPAEPDSPKAPASPTSPTSPQS